MTKSQMLIALGEIIRKISDLRAVLTTEGMHADAESLYTIENDLIWQYRNIAEFSETE